VGRRISEQIATVELVPIGLRVQARRSDPMTAITNTNLKRPLRLGL
jgi:hypothetical protein